MRYQTEFDAQTLADWDQIGLIFNAIRSRQDIVRMETERGPLQIHAYRHVALTSWITIY